VRPLAARHFDRMADLDDVGPRLDRGNEPVEVVGLCFNRDLEADRDVQQRPDAGLMKGLATVLAGVGDYANFPTLLAFGLATAALAGMAWVVSFATEQVGEQFGPGLTGLLQSTLGNLPELFVVIFALRAGETVVAQTSILGSIFANALLVLGLVIVVGARASEDSCMRFKTRLPNDTATLLLVTSFIIVVVGLILGSHDPAAHHVKAISTIAAVSLLLVYVAWVVPYVRADHAEHGGADRPAARLPARRQHPAGRHQEAGTGLGRR